MPETLLHEFGPDQVCTYCGLAEDKAVPKYGRQCPARIAQATNEKRPPGAAPTEANLFKLHAIGKRLAQRARDRGLDLSLRPEPGGGWSAALGEVRTGTYPDPLDTAEELDQLTQ